MALFSRNYNCFNPCYDGMAIRTLSIFPYLKGALPVSILVMTEWPLEQKDPSRAQAHCLVSILVMTEWPLKCALGESFSYGEAGFNPCYDGRGKPFVAIRTSPGHNIIKPIAGFDPYYLGRGKPFVASQTLCCPFFGPLHVAWFQSLL